MVADTERPLTHGHAFEHGHSPGPDLLGRAVVDAQGAGAALRGDPAPAQNHLPAIDALVGISDQKEVVRPDWD